MRVKGFVAIAVLAGVVAACGGSGTPAGSDGGQNTTPGSTPQNGRVALVDVQDLCVLYSASEAGALLGYPVKKGTLSAAPHLGDKNCLYNPADGDANKSSIVLGLYLRPTAKTDYETVAASGGEYPTHPIAGLGKKASGNEYATVVLLRDDAYLVISIGKTATNITGKGVAAARVLLQRLAY